jgi:hypothetical protein
MLDHVLLDLIGAIRRGFGAALLERQAVEERFQADVFLGDLSWETSYSLPGEENPPRVRADVSLDWPTWSQSAYRSWSIGEPPDDLPELVVEVALRIQRLAAPPDPSVILAALPTESPPLGPEPLRRSRPTIEQTLGDGETRESFAVEVSYEGTWELDESVLENPSSAEQQLGGIGSWVASTLVRLSDLGLAFLPPDDEEANLR